MMIGSPVTSVLSQDEIDAVVLLRDRLGVDAIRSYAFWEAVVARLTSGEVTGHQCPWDVELEYGDDLIRIEVKYGQEFESRFGSGVRRVMKFVAPDGRKTPKAADVVVLIGVDALGDAYTWVLPAEVTRHVSSITVTSPRDRTGPDRSGVASGRSMPLDQLLPEVLRAYREQRASR